MSYRNPKYTYVSSQPAFKAMQDSIVASGREIADRKRKKIEQERKDGDRTWALGQGATQNYLNNTLDTNTIGSQDTKGAVGRLFEGTGAKVGELTRLTSGPSAQCRADGNCDELMKELAELQAGPGIVKKFITNLTSQLDTDGFLNFDNGQNSRALKAGAILQGTSKLNEADGYTYDLVRNDDNTYDIKFKYSGKEKDGGFFNPETGEYETDFSMNSGAFENMDQNENSLFVQTPVPAKLTGSLLEDSGIYNGATYDKDKKRTGGVLNAEQFMELKDPNDPSAGYVQLSRNFGTLENPNNKFIGKIDPKRVENNQGVKRMIELQVDDFIGPGGNDGQARAFWNMHLSKSGNGENQFDEDLARDLFGKDLEVSELKTKWGDTTTAWSYNDELTNEQKEIFKSVYSKYMVNQIVYDLNQQSNDREMIIGQDATYIPVKTGNGWADPKDLKTS